MNNLLTIANNFGAYPVIVKGKRIKHANWLGNKQDVKIKNEFFEQLDDKLLYFLDSCQNKEHRAYIIHIYNYLLEGRLWKEKISRKIIHNINSVLSINGELKKSTKNYYRNDAITDKFEFDDILLSRTEIVNIKKNVEELAQFILKYENIRFHNWKNRNNRIQDQIHKVSHYLVEYCKKNDVGRIIIGYNEYWKQGVKIGKKNAQNFVFIPFLDLIKKIKYKAELAGIEVIRINERYTSKCSSFDFEPIKHHNIYLGRRITRGLFRTQDNQYINSDVNAAFNILRIGIRGILDEYRYSLKKRNLMLLSPVSVVI